MRMAKHFPELHHNAREFCPSQVESGVEGRQEHDKVRGGDHADMMCQHHRRTKLPDEIEKGTREVRSEAHQARWLPATVQCRLAQACALQL